MEQFNRPGRHNDFCRFKIIANLFHIPCPKSILADFRRSLRKRDFAAWREISKTGATA